MKYRLAGRSYTVMSFIEVKNADEDCTPEPKKIEKVKNFEKMIFSKFHQKLNRKSKKKH